MEGLNHLKSQTERKTKEFKSYYLVRQRQVRSLLLEAEKNASHKSRAAQALDCSFSLIVSLFFFPFSDSRMQAVGINHVSLHPI